MNSVVLLGLILGFTFSIYCDVPFNTTTLSEPKIALSSIEVDGSVYFAGGYAYHDLVASDRIDIFNLSNQTWNESLTLPKARALITPLVVDPYIYFVGGEYYKNVPYYFSADAEDFVALNATPPTVFRPIRTSIYNNVVTLIGLHSVDFLNTTSGEWHTVDMLTSVTRSVYSAFIFSVEDLVYVLGGMNITSKENMTTGWIFNVTSSELIQTTLPDNFDASLPYKFHRAYGVTVIWAGNQTHINDLGGEWQSFSMRSDFTTVQSLDTTTFIFTTAGYVTYDHATRKGIKTITAGIISSWTFDDTVSYIIASVVTNGTGLRTFQNGGWIATNVSQSIRNVLGTVRWGDLLVLYSPEELIVFDPSALNFTTVFNYQNISSVFPYSSTDLYAFAQGPNGIIVIYGSLPLLQFVHSPRSSTGGIPDVVIGGQAMAVNGRFYTLASSYTSTLSATFKPSPSSTLVWTHDEDRYLFVMVDPSDDALPDYRHTYNSIDVYNYRNKTWEDSIPIIEDITEPASVYLPAAAVGNNILMWSDRYLAILDLASNNTWSQPLLNGTTVTINHDDIYHVFDPVTMVNDTAYLTVPNEQRLFKFSPQSLAGWQSTALLMSDTFFRIRQVVSYQDEKLFASGTLVDGNTGLESDVFEVMYVYDVAADQWQITYPPTKQAQVTIALVGSFLLSMGNTTSLDYLYIPSGTWYTQQISVSVLPSTVISTRQRLTIVAGGQDLNYPLFVDSVLLFDDDEIFVPPTPPARGNDTSLAPGGPSEDYTTLVVAVVVPIGAVVIAGAILLVMLMRRNQKKKKMNKSKMSTIGLDKTYGQWFIPYNEIKFGEQIGQGASGQVFKGTWKGTTVALKVSMTQANSTVIIELELMMQLRPHPHVVQLFGFSVHPETDSIILVIEYCNGGSLDDTLFEQTTQLSKEQKLSWMLGIAKGLSHLHSNNIVHRDVAARNVLLNQNEPKITDFGMSRLVDDESQRGTTKSELGPIRWMAPESLKNKEYSTKSDIWSFGVLMYEIDAQQEPHLKADPIEIGRLIRDNGVTPDASSCPIDLASLMKECWQMNPEQRLSIDDVISRLEKLN